MIITCFIYFKFKIYKYIILKSFLVDLTFQVEFLKILIISKTKFKFYTRYIYIYKYWVSYLTICDIYNEKMIFIIEAQ